jgi:cysteine synthase A/cysteine synthase B
MSLLTEIADDSHGFGIGNTPLFKLGNTGIYSKLEYYNHFRSIKDRAAFFMLDYALKTGILKKGMTVIEGSSGNTGIAIAGISQLMGLKSEIIVPESTPEETVKTLKMYGADVVITSGNSTENSINYAVKKALASPEKYFRPGQHENEMNSNAHYYGTGPEIAEKISQPDHLVIGIGTGGTITGLSRFFKGRGNIRVTGIIPENGSQITGLRNPFLSDYNSLIEEYEDYIDEVVTISQDDAYRGVKELQEKYNLFCRPFVGC